MVVEHFQQISNLAKTLLMPTGYQIKDHENHAVHLYSNEVILEKVDYIHNNPIRNKVVSKPEAYMYSSAIDYTGQKSLLEITLITKLWKTYQ